MGEHVHVGVVRRLKRGDHIVQRGVLDDGQQIAVSRVTGIDALHRLIALGIAEGRDRLLQRSTMGVERDVRGRPGHEQNARLGGPGDALDRNRPDVAGDANRRVGLKREPGLGFTLDGRGHFGKLEGQQCELRRRQRDPQMDHREVRIPLRADRARQAWHRREHASHVDAGIAKLREPVVGNAGIAKVAKPPLEDGVLVRNVHHACGRVTGNGEVWRQR